MKLIKKLIIAGIGLGIFLFLLATVTNYFWPELYDPFYNQPVVQYTDPKLDENYSYVANEYGGSMTEFGRSDGGEAKIYPNKPCSIGSICAFTCNTEKCKLPCNDPRACKFGSNFESYIKKLVKKNGDCYWFEGNKDILEKDGIKYISFDSRNYGYLCPPDDVKIEGVVIQ